MVNNKIGGEFEISPEYVRDSAIYIIKQNKVLFSSGRSALMSILETIKASGCFTIYIPFYICSSVVSACRHAGFKTKFYELDRDFLVPISLLDEVGIGESVLSVNYFGLVDDNPRISNIKSRRSDIIIISDHVQSFWTCKSSKADFSFTSLRKQIATPDGALVYQKGQLFQSNKTLRENVFFQSKLRGAISKYNKEVDSVFLNFFEEGERILDNDKNITRASCEGHFLFENINYESIIKQRKNNYKTIYELGRELKIDFVFEFSSNKIPLCVPIRLKNRDKVRKGLMQKGIYLPIHWPIADYNQTSNLAKDMCLHELSLVIDQRYTKEDMIREIEVINKLIK